MKFITPVVVCAALVLPGAVLAKLPPLSDEAKAKAAEAAAKTAHANKVEAFKLCQYQERAAAHYFRTTKKDPKSATATAACADPGPFVPATAAAQPTAAPAAAPAAVAPKDAKKS